MCGASPGSKMRMYGEVPHPPLRSPAMCLQNLFKGAEATPRSSDRPSRAGVGGRPSGPGSHPPKDPGRGHACSAQLPRGATGMAPTIAALWVYPVKACQGIQVRTPPRALRSRDCQLVRRCIMMTVTCSLPHPRAAPRWLPAGQERDAGHARLRPRSHLLRRRPRRHPAS
eukprot:COSAG06_NODE_3498_length_5262_cov_47.593453_3_plen_170_part_00